MNKMLPYVIAACTLFVSCDNRSRAEKAKQRYIENVKKTFCDEFHDLTDEVMRHEDEDESGVAIDLYKQGLEDIALNHADVLKKHGKEKVRGKWVDKEIGRVFLNEFYIYRSGKVIDSFTCASPIFKLKPKFKAQTDTLEQ